MYVCGESVQYVCVHVCVYTVYVCVCKHVHICVICTCVYEYACMIMCVHMGVYT